jgi:hypothetical protein
METTGVIAGGQYAPKDQFTRDEVKGIVKYTNRVQGLAYGGAAMLVVIIGLRALYGRRIPEEIVLAALGLEAFLLLMIALVYYMTPEDKGGSAPSTDSQILSGEKEILHLLKRDVIPGESEMIKVLKNDIAGAQRELIAIMRNEFLPSQREMTSVLRTEFMDSSTESLKVLQRTETHIGKMNELLTSQHQVYNALRSELISGEAEALRVLQQIETHIGKVVENEIERVVQEKVQQVFTSMVRQEVHKSLEANRTKA